MWPVITSLILPPVTTEFKVTRRPLLSLAQNVWTSHQLLPRRFAIFKANELHRLDCLLVRYSGALAAIYLVGNWPSTLPLA